jgi:hypothetical protein
MTYKQEDWATVADLLRPTPERLATAKAWLVGQLNDRGSVSWGQAGQYVAELNIPHPSASGRDPRDPANQEDQLAYWQAWLDVRYALYELVQQGFLVATVQGINTADPGGIWNTEGPRIALGEPGQPSTETEFPTVPLIGGEYRWSIAESAQRSARLELYDADLFLRKAELAVFGGRVRRCVEEAIACYRADLFLAAANMLGAASEAAWHEIAERMRAAELGGTKLSTELERDNPVIARLQQYVLQGLREIEAASFKQRFGFARSALLSVEQVARFWRDLRNYGMHPGDALAPETFSQASTGVQIMGASGYLGKLAAILRGL